MPYSHEFHCTCITMQNSPRVVKAKSEFLMQPRHLLVAEVAVPAVPHLLCFSIWPCIYLIWKVAVLWINCETWASAYQKIMIFTSYHVQMKYRSSLQPGTLKWKVPVHAKNRTTIAQAPHKMVSRSPCSLVCKINRLMRYVALYLVQSC